MSEEAIGDQHAGNALGSASAAAVEVELPAAPVGTAGPRTEKQSRVSGLDSLRFVLACWVMIGHLGQRPYAGLMPRTTFLWLAVRAIYTHLISGPSAVIVFFVISGFCIHFPHRYASRVALFPYYARRHVRILIPAMAAIWLAQIEGVRFSLFMDAILWSLICEEFYYTIYPALLALRQRWGWPSLIGISLIVALDVAATKPGAANYPSFGWKLNWLLGLPCWLMGCHLAQRWDALRAHYKELRHPALWGWRVGILILSAICSALRFHTPVTYPWTLNLFAIAAAMWIEREICFALDRPPARILEWAGGFSYSLYVIHVQCQVFFHNHFSLRTTVFAGWILVNIFTLVVAYIFYRLVEKPSHRLARLVFRVLTAHFSRPAKARLIP